MESSVSAYISSESTIISDKVWSYLYEYIKLIFTWPGAVILLGVIYRFELKNLNFKNLLSLLQTHLKSIYTPWVGVDLKDQQLNNPISKEKTKIDAIKKEIDVKADTKAKEYIEKEILPIIIKLEKKIRFERIWNIIFGGQLEILQAVSSNAKPGSVLLSIYNSKITKYPWLPHPTFISYIGYLINEKLIEKHPGETEDTFSITTLGKEFLNYILIDRSYNMSVKMN